MYDFPPTSWQYQDWSINAATVLRFLGVVVAIGFLCLRVVTNAACILWFGVASFAYCQLPLTQPVPRNFTWHANLSEFTMGVLLIVVTALGALWTARAHHHKRSVNGGTVQLMLLGTAMGMSLSAVHAVLSHPGHWAASLQTECKYNLKHIGLAMHNYYDDYQRFPFAHSWEPNASWRLNMLPYLDENEVYDSYMMSEPWDSAANLKTAKTRVRAFDCPMRPDEKRTDAAGRFMTAYVVPRGEKTLFNGKANTTFRDVVDGTSNTFLVVEACGSNIAWTEPRDVSVDELAAAVNLPGNQQGLSGGLLSSYHGQGYGRGGAQALFADGSVRFIPDSIDRKNLNALLTPASGDETGDW